MTLNDAADICHTAFDGGASVDHLKAKADAARECGKLYDFAELLLKADRVLGTIRTPRPAFDALCDKPTYLGDLGPLSREIKALADAWQDEIDGEPT